MDYGTDVEMMQIREDDHLWDKCSSSLICPNMVTCTIGCSRNLALGGNNLEAEINGHLICPMCAR